MPSSTITIRIWRRASTPSNLAFRMQVKAPEAFEVEKESEETKKLYGLDNEVTRDFGWQCLLARRLSERGVRFVQCSHSYWDQHTQIAKIHPELAAAGR